MWVHVYYVKGLLLDVYLKQQASRPVFFLLSMVVVCTQWLFNEKKVSGYTLYHPGTENTVFRDNINFVKIVGIQHEECSDVFNHSWSKVF